MKPTARGVYYDLKYSPYQYEFLNYKLYFASQASLTRFCMKQAKIADEMENKLHAITPFRISVAFFNVFSAYIQCERRGFYVVDSGANTVYTSISEMGFLLYPYKVVKGVNGRKEYFKALRRATEKAKDTEDTKG